MLGAILSLLNPIGKAIAAVANETTVRMGLTLKYSKDVMTSAMNHNIYWYVWAAAAIPSVVWYAWGMIDTTWPGHISHVAVPPKALQVYFDLVWQNIFWTGAAGYGIHTAGRFLDRLFGGK